MIGFGLRWSAVCLFGCLILLPKGWAGEAGSIDSQNRSTTAAPGAQVVAVRIDGTSATGLFAGATDRVISIEDEHRLDMPIDDLRWLRFVAASPAKPRGGRTSTFYLRDGGHLLGTITGEAAEAVSADTSLGAPYVLRFDDLVGIRFGGHDLGRSADELFEAEMADRLIGKDKLLTHRNGQFGTIRGNVAALGPDGGRFLFNNVERPFSREVVFAVVFATGLSREERWPMTVTTTDGSTFSGRLLSGDRKRLSVASSFGAEVTVPLDEVVSLRFSSSRLKFLSDLTPVRDETTGLVLSAEPARFDRSVSNGPLAIDGQAFEKGVGVHARSQLEYDLAGRYDTFAATIGIDDAVRPDGHVVFQVTGDGRLLFDSGPITGRDAPREISIDVRGVTKLSLVVEFGEELDLSDHADWADARLIKPSESRETGETGEPRRPRRGPPSARGGGGT